MFHSGFKNTYEIHISSTVWRQQSYTFLACHALWDGSHKISVEICGKLTDINFAACQMVRWMSVENTWQQGHILDLHHPSALLLCVENSAKNLLCHIPHTVLLRNGDYRRRTVYATMVSLCLCLGTSDAASSPGILHQFMPYSSWLLCRRGL